MNFSGNEDKSVKNFDRQLLARAKLTYLCLLLTQKEVAKALKTSVASVRSWCNGIKLKKANLEKIEQFPEPAMTLAEDSDRILFIMDDTEND